MMMIALTESIKILQTYCIALVPECPQ